MAEPLADRVIRRIGQAAGLYHRLILLVAPAGTGKTATEALAEQDGGRGLEWHHRRRAHGLCDAESPRIQTISLTRFPGS